MKQVILSLLGVAIFIAAVGFLTQKLKNKETPAKKEVSINNVKIPVEVANTESLRRNGLGQRTKLAEGSGMIFIFDQKDIFPSFWMKDMLISIDIIWINDGKVVKIDKNVEPPAPGTSDSQLKLYRPDSPIDYVLEVNTGFSDKSGIKVGDSVDLSGI